ncbi:MAG: hypothetical protein NDI90_13130 [Nitrospira sp. BO4]|jgi:hypothetical protein|nr:hypothetical protein [Nitrospira sp. BO4]
MLKYALCALAAFLVVIGVVPNEGWSEQTSSTLHRSLQGVIVDKAGSPAVKVPDGTVYLLNKNRALRHGHELPKVGEEVTVILDENNAVLEVHPKGTESKHRFITGDVVAVGLRQGTITLKTPEGEQSFPLEKRELSASIRDGATVTAEINEVGSVIDLHPAEHRQLQPGETSTPINRSH